MEYIVIERNEVEQLIEDVQEYIDAGWEPCGGVAVTVCGVDRDGDPDGWFYTQALIRRSKQS